METFLYILLFIVIFIVVSSVIILIGIIYFEWNEKLERYYKERMNSNNVFFNFIRPKTKKIDPTFASDRPKDGKAKRRAYSTKYGRDTGMSRKRRSSGNY